MDQRKIEIFWSARSLSDLNQIHDFNIELKGKPKADHLVNTLQVLIQERLSQKIDGSMPDVQFAHLRLGIRKILSGFYKISFLENEGRRIIIRIFDMRQHPDKNF